MISTTPRPGALSLQHRSEVVSEGNSGCLQQLASRTTSETHYGTPKRVLASGVLRSERFEESETLYTFDGRKVDTLDVNVGRIILRIKEVLPSGVLMLQGRDGKNYQGPR